MRRLLLTACLALWAWPAFAQVVAIGIIESHTVAATASASEASFDFAATDIGTSQGVFVCVIGLSSATVDATSVDFVSGPNIPAVASATATDTVSEPGFAKLYFLGSGVPTGTQTVRVTRNNNANLLYAYLGWVTAGGNTQITNAPVLLSEDGALAEQSVDDSSPGTNSMRFACAFSGSSSAIGAGANSTVGPAQDLGSVVAGSVFETTAGQGSRSIGFSVTSNGRAAVHFAISQSAAAGTNCGDGLLLGVGRCR